MRTRKTRPTPGQWMLVGWLAFALATLVLRPALPVDETRYLGVALEMAQRGDLWLLHHNGGAYDHKPPLLFWLINAAWAVTGIHDWSARLVPILLTLLNARLLVGLTTRLYPDDAGRADRVLLLFFGTTYLALYQTALMFDPLLLTGVLLAWLGLLRGTRGEPAGPLYFGAGLAIGLLAKGPVIWVYTVPALLLIPLLQPVPAFRRRPYADALLAALIPLGLWLLLAERSEPGMLHRLIVVQTLERITGSHAAAHPRPLWWYLPLIPLLLLPWSAWPPLWRAVLQHSRALHSTPAGRWLAWLAAVILVSLSLIGGKQVHYLLPLLTLACVYAHGLLLAPAAVPVTVTARLRPLLAQLAWTGAGPLTGTGDPRAHLTRHILPLLLAAGGLTALLLAAAVAAHQHPPDTVAQLLPVLLAALIVLAALLLAVRQHTPRTGLTAAASLLTLALIVEATLGRIGDRYDLRDIAQRAGQAEHAGRPIAWVGHYQNELRFYGRLTQPVTALRPEDAAAWIARHPDALVILRQKRLADETRIPPTEHRQPYRSDALLGFRGEVLTASGARFDDG